MCLMLALPVLATANPEDQGLCDGVPCDPGCSGQCGEPRPMGPVLTEPIVEDEEEFNVIMTELPMTGAPLWVFVVAGVTFVAVGKGILKVS